MAANKKPKKKYKPKYEKGTLPVTLRHSNNADLDLKLIPHYELDKFREGNADEVSLNTLAFRLNWGYLMATEVFKESGIEAVTVTVKGLDAIRSVMDRHNRIAKFGMSGEEFAAIGSALNLIDEMQANATRREQLMAIRVAKEFSIEKFKVKQ